MVLPSEDCIQFLLVEKITGLYYMFMSQEKKWNISSVSVERTCDEVQIIQDHCPNVQHTWLTIAVLQLFTGIQ